jgi:hypothetical protein
MTIMPSAEMLAKLRAWRCAHAAPAFVRDAIGEDAAYIGGTIGAWWFLTTDGRVLEYPDEDAGAVVRELRGNDAWWVLADCAWSHGFPELLDLLPEAPAGSTPCLDCRGTRYIMMRGDVAQTRACYQCHGVGWRVA